MHASMHACIHMPMHKYACVLSVVEREGFALEFAAEERRKDTGLPKFDCFQRRASGFVICGCSVVKGVVGF